MLFSHPYNIVLFFFKERKMIRKLSPKRLLSFALISVFTVSTAFAEKSSKPVLGDGFYVGVNGGYSYATVKYDHNEGTAHLRFKLNGYVPILGLLTGYGKRIGDNYFAGEVGGNYLFNKDYKQNIAQPFPYNKAHNILQFSYQSQFSISALYGRYYSKRLLFFGRLGFVESNTDSSIHTLFNTTNTKLIITTKKSWVPGVSVGAGLQYALMNKLSVRLEYHFTYNFPVKYLYSYLDRGPGFDFEEKFSMISQSIRASLVYTF